MATQEFVCAPENEMLSDVIIRGPESGHSFDELQTHLLSCEHCQASLEYLWDWYQADVAIPHLNTKVPEGITTKEELLKVVFELHRLEDEQSDHVLQSLGDKLGWNEGVIAVQDLLQAQTRLLRIAPHPRASEGIKQQLLASVMGKHHRLIEVLGEKEWIVLVGGTSALPPSQWRDVTPENIEASWKSLLGL